MKKLSTSNIHDGGHHSDIGRWMFVVGCWMFVFSAFTAAAESTNTINSVTAPSLPDASLSIVRVFGALALVLGLFLGGVWMFKNWQRLAIQRGRAPKLNILEVKSLGGRNSIFVVGYEQERFLISAAPNGVNLLSHLPAAPETSPETESKPATPSFSEALRQVLKGK